MNINQDNKLSQKDIDDISRIIYRNCDDIAVSIARSLERLEERVDAMESRMYSRMIELEDKIETIDDRLYRSISEEVKGAGNKLNHVISVLEIKQD